MLSKLTAEQMTKMTTPRLLEWFRKARKIHQAYEVGSEEALGLHEQMMTAKSILDTREHVKSSRKE